MHPRDATNSDPVWLGLSLGFPDAGIDTVADGAISRYESSTQEPPLIRLVVIAAVYVA
jgi:hypothetical protein